LTSPELSLPNYIGHLTSSKLRDAMETGDGFATFACESEEAFLAAARDFGTVMPHRHADTRGISVLRDIPQLGEERDLTFSNGVSLPHTERPALKTPPRVLILWCRSGSTEGGEATLQRGADVVDRLGELDRAALKAFSEDDAAIFQSDDDEVRCAVFQIQDGVLQEMRMRFDPKKVYFAADAALAMPSLVRAIQETERVVPVVPGKGYAVRNDLWLHGRRAFSGGREMARIMIASQDAARPVEL
jgi:Taurine catabolism dioxygenase TauD, TfdA family